MTRDERIQHANEIFDMVWGDEGKRENWNTLDDCVSDLLGWAEEVADDPGPYKASNEKIATELRKIAERLKAIDLDGAA